MIDFAPGGGMLPSRPSITDFPAAEARRPSVPGADSAAAKTGMNAPIDPVAADKERRRRALEAMIAQQAGKEKQRTDQRRHVAQQRAAQPIWSRYQGKEKQREAEAAAIKAQERAAELDGCTFAPAINERSRDLSTSRRVVSISSRRAVVPVRKNNPIPIADPD